MSAARAPADLATMVERRAAGLPLEHVIGWAEFCGLRITVAPGVFVPRRRSEFLVRQARQLASGPGTVVADVCCGSGALGAALASALGGAERPEVHACDIDPAAVACTRRNLAVFGGQVYEGDLCDALPATLRGRVDIMLANAPYVPTTEVALLPPEARVHEPRVALDGGADGLDVLRRVIAAAPRWLAPGGHLLAETSGRQAARAASLMARAGLRSRVACDDELNATVVIGTRRAGCPGVPGGRARRAWLPTAGCFPPAPASS
jgi:release factor glutamine methyltransferase